MSKLAGHAPAFFMSRVLRTFLVCFQWLPLAPGISVRHACDMNEKSFLASDVTRDDVSNFLLGSTELARLGAFERAPWVDSEAFAAADYELRIALLGVGDSGSRRKTRRTVPPSVDTGPQARPDRAGCFIRGGREL